MSIVLPDVVVREAIIDGLNTIASDLDLWLPIIFARSSEAERRELEKWFLGWLAEEAEPETRTARQPKVILGYPRAAAELPCIAVTLEEAREDVQAHGEMVYDATAGMPNDPSRNFQIRGSIYGGTVAIHCVAVNAKLTIWLQAMVNFTLHFNRDWMMEDDQGLDAQKIDIGAFVTTPEWLPKPAFARIVRLSFIYENTYIVYVSTLEKVTVEDHTVEGAGAGATWLRNGGRPL